MALARNRKRDLHVVPLKVVQRPTFYEGTLCSARDLTEAPPQSLHQISPLPFEIAPGAVSTALQALSKPGDTVLDPFCGSGTVGLEGLLAERNPLLNDTDPVALAFAQAKLWPCDLTEVALWLQMSPLNTPASLEGYDQYFSPFYSAATFRELSALRRQLLSRRDRLTGFLKGLALGLLHGRGAGNFSVYSPSEKALSTEQQQEFNRRRNHFPDYRAVAPRLLRKSAMVLQDGLPSALFRSDASAKVTGCDPRELSHIRTASVDLVLTNPPIPRHHVAQGGNWLRRWFLGLREVERSTDLMNPLRWSGRMNEVLVEMARVARPGGRIALFCDRRWRSSEELQSSRQELLRLVQEELAFCLEPECFLALPEQRVSITGKKRGDGVLRFQADPEGVLVLRRK